MGCEGLSNGRLAKSRRAVYPQFMDSSRQETDDRVRAALEGDKSAFADLFSQHRDRLRRMVCLRMDQRAQGRFDASDVLQDAYLDAARRLPEYASSSSIPFFLWLRLTVGQRLAKYHRRHLGTALRSAAKEVALEAAPLPAASSVVLANQLAGDLTSASEKICRVELLSQIQAVLNDLPVADREILALRHFEELSNQEAALVLGVSASAASTRYGRAIRRFAKAARQIGVTPGALQAP